MERGADDPQWPEQIRALVEYDGTEYFGFQIQSGKATIQGELERVLAHLTGKPCRVRYAGRTDAGVHAIGQVISVRPAWRHSLIDLERAWNALLPGAIAVRQVEAEADPRFHPRYSARSRVYRYSVWTSRWRSPLHHRYTHHEPRPLDLALMNEAAAQLIGIHDFASFGQPTQGEVTIREVYRASWQPIGPLVVFDIEANAFLRRMVRTIVGTLLEVGLGRQNVTSIAEILAAKNRSTAAPPAPASGLCLVEVKYSSEEQERENIHYQA